MSLELYNDRVIYDAYDSGTGKIESGCELDDEREFGGESHVKQLLEEVSHWCTNCECAFRKADVTDDKPKCPVCGVALEDFDLENIVPDLDLDVVQDEEGNWVPVGD